MDNKEKQIWDMVHTWCNEQASDIPDINRRVLMDRILAIVMENRNNYNSNFKKDLRSEAHRLRHAKQDCSGNCNQQKNGGVEVGKRDTMKGVVEKKLNCTHPWAYIESAFGGKMVCMNCKKLL